MNLSHLPTPLDDAPRLSAELGLRILIKRDDLTGLAMGGNKARKLDYLMRDAVEKECDTVVTAGGAQSNFARMTAAAAARLGMKCHLVLSGEPPARDSGNILLDRIFGAELHFAGPPEGALGNAGTPEGALGNAGTADWDALWSEVQRIAAEIGQKAYPMPIGGSTPIGSLGYVAAADELLAQMDAPPNWIVHATSSGGTQAGLLAGLPREVRVLGIDVARPPTPLAISVPKLAAKTALLARRPPPAGEVIIADHCGPHYASITKEGQDAVRLAARTEALVLDPVYSGKAMAGLIAAVKDGSLSGTVVFLHTGGAPALFADEFAAF